MKMIPENTIGESITEKQIKNPRGRARIFVAWLFR